MSDAATSSLDKDAQIAELEAALAARDTLIDTLRFQLAQLRRMTFGQSSEKLSAQLELTLEELEGEAAVADARKDAPAAKPERPVPVRALPRHLPRAEQRIEPEASHCNCPDCGGVLRPLGEDSDEMLDVLPVLREDRAGVGPGEGHRPRQGQLRHGRPCGRVQVRPSSPALPASRDDGGAGP